MGDKTAVRTREKWADDVKVIACILDVLGHFFQSMTKANILPENDLYEWFETTIYYFLSSVKVAAVGLIVALTAKVLILTGRGYSVYAVSTVLSNEIWFVLGMSICAFNVQLKGKRVQGTICELLFVILSIVVYTVEISVGVISFAMGLLACVAVILMVAGFEEKFGRGMDFLAKYTMPIFLMHTLFAAPMRSILMKIGVENAVIHVALGLGISFAGPIMAACIMKKTKWLEFFLYPNKFIRKVS